ncbi:MAG: hypothetical protein RLZZ628_2075 [Bacteroidota bacterium]|jgi:hypothetical protein
MKKFKTASTEAIRSCLKPSKGNAFGDDSPIFEPKDYFYLSKCRLCLLAAEDNGCNNEICSNSEEHFHCF